VRALLIFSIFRRVPFRYLINHALHSYSEESYLTRFRAKATSCTSTALIIARAQL
jgi:hypothetical protein